MTTLEIAVWYYGTGAVLAAVLFPFRHKLGAGRQLIYTDMGLFTMIENSTGARMKQWLEQHEAEMRAVYRVVILCAAVWALVLLKDIHRYRGEPDIRGLEASVDQIRKDLAKIREQREPPPTRSGVGGIIFPAPQSTPAESQYHLRQK